MPGSFCACAAPRSFCSHPCHLTKHTDSHFHQPPMCLRDITHTVSTHAGYATLRRTARLNWPSVTHTVSTHAGYATLRRTARLNWPSVAHTVSTHAGYATLRRTARLNWPLITGDMKRWFARLTELNNSTKPSAKEEKR